MEVAANSNSADDEQTNGTSRNPKRELSCKWKLASHAIGASIFFQPYAVGGTGIIMFCLIVMIEAYVASNSLVMVRKMAPKKIKCIGRTNYFTIVSENLGDGQRSWNIIIALFVLEVVICCSLYFRLVSEIIYSTCWLVESSKHERSGYHLTICFGIALFLIIAEYVTKIITRLKDSTVYTWIFANTITTVLIRPETDSNPNPIEENVINMNAVLERVRGYYWRRFWLLLFFMFLSIAIVQLYCELSISDLSLVNVTDSCPGLLSPKYLVGSNWRISSTVSVVILSIMQYAIFLPICLEELRMPVLEYRKCIWESSVVFVIVFCAGAVLVYCILGDSTPVLFPVAFGSNILAMNLKGFALLFIMEAMLLRIMACCKLVQVLFKCESDSSYWTTAMIIFVISYFISYLTPSVWYLAIISGGCTCNLLLIILPRLAYVNFLRKNIDETSRNQARSADSKDSSDPSPKTDAAAPANAEEEIEPIDECRKWEIFQTKLCVALHIVLLVTMIPNIVLTDVSVGTNCYVLFDKLWK